MKEAKIPLDKGVNRIIIKENGEDMYISNDKKSIDFSLKNGALVIDLLDNV